MAPRLGITLEGDLVTGELALDLAPGMVAAQQRKSIDEALGEALASAAGDLGVVVAAAPHRFAFPLPGKDPEGRTRFSIGARAEGGRLVPARPAPKKTKPQ